MKRSVTPPLTPISVAPPEKGPVTMPANMLTERMPPRARSSRFSTLPAATDKIVISRNVLLGLCLTTFAFGIVTTLTIDHLHARASEAPTLREPDPVVLQTTPIEAPAKATSAAPSEQSRSPSPVVQPQAAAAEAVVVQLPQVVEKAAEKPKAMTRPIAHPPVRTAATTASLTTAAHKRTSTKLQRDTSSSETEAAPDETSAMPEPTKKKWVDPFDQ